MRLIASRYFGTINTDSPDVYYAAELTDENNYIQLGFYCSGNRLDPMKISLADDAADNLATREPVNRQLLLEGYANGHETIRDFIKSIREEVSGDALAEQSLHTDDPGFDVQLLQNLSFTRAGFHADEPDFFAVYEYEFDNPDILFCIMVVTDINGKLVDFSLE